MSRRSFGLSALLSLAGLAGCKPPEEEVVTPTMTEAAQQADALTIYEELEALIAEGKDSEQDRTFALDRVRGIADDQSAAYAFARAAILGRVAELRGVKAGKLVTEAEQYARLSIERDAAWRDMAATRMLGSLYVMAPGRLVEHGDSESGLALLEKLAADRPDDTRNHLRLAEAYIHLGDPEPALPHLCTSVSGRDALRADEAALLDRLIADIGGSEVLGCESGGA